MATTINAGNATTGAAISADTTGILALQSGSTPTTAVTVDTSQNVGIGTTSPSVKLHVDGTGSQYLRLSSTSNSNFVQSFCVSGSTGQEYKSVYRLVDTDVGERMRIDSSGNVNIGTTSPLQAGCKFNVVGQSGAYWASAIQIGTNGYPAISFLNASASQQGYIQTNSASVQYISSSDYRLKENVQPMTGGLAKVAQLKPVTYKWKEDGSDGQGFIAHELAEIVPDCVAGEKDAVDEDGNPRYQGIDTSFLVATLTAAIQELNAKVDAQATTIAELQARTA